MPTDDYSTPVRGGLKLKGSSSSSKPSGISKKKKKKATTETESKTTNTPQEEQDYDTKKAAAGGSGAGEEEIAEEVDQDLKQLEPRDRMGDGKTATERAQEEMRRRRLQERFQKQGGVKTHKQRVEELNRYLSNLSEHHDMPRIGPG